LTFERLSEVPLTVRHVLEMADELAGTGVGRDRGVRVQGVVGAGLCHAVKESAETTPILCGRPSPRNWPVKVPERRIARYASGGRLDTILGCTAIAGYGQIHSYFSATVHNNAEQAALSGTVGKDRDLGSPYR
jgi:hypothetical protein